MRKLIFLICSIALISCSCQWVGGKKVRGNGRISRDTRKVSAFKDIRVSGAIDLEITQDSVRSLVIETDENLRPFISVEQEGDALIIGTRNGYSLSPSFKIIVHVSNPQFRELSGSGACTLSSKNQIGTGAPLFFVLSGASDISMDVKAEKVSVDASGASEIRLKGQTRDLKIEGSGSTEIRCFDLLAENTDVSISGAGDAEVFASVKLNANITGAGDIRYKGNAEVTKDISGAGTIKKE